MSNELSITPREGRTHNAQESVLNARLALPRGIVAIQDDIDPQLLSAMRFLGSQEEVTTHELGAALDDWVDPAEDYKVILGSNKRYLHGQAFYNVTSEADKLVAGTLLVSDRIHCSDKTIQFGVSDREGIAATVSPQSNRPDESDKETLHLDEKLTLRLLDHLLLQQGFDDNHRDRTVGINNKVRALIESARVFQTERKAQYEWIEANGDRRSLRIQRVVRSVGGAVAKQLIVSSQLLDTLPKGAGQLRTAVHIDTGMQTAKVKSPAHSIVAAIITDTSLKKMPYIKRNKLFDDLLTSVRTYSGLKKRLGNLAAFLSGPEAIIHGLSDISYGEPQLFDKQ